jgi:O-antigen/teichoic acid export membrane protein
MLTGSLRKTILRCAGYIGMDRAIFFTIVARATAVGSGFLIIFFITKYLSLERQGYYYTFYSLIALQIFIELGLNVAIVQFVSHEMANLSVLPRGSVQGDPESKERLKSVTRFAFIWLGCGSFIMILLLIPLGAYFFSSVGNNSLHKDNDVLFPWILLVISSSLGIALNAAFSILEGVGKIKQVAQIRTSQTIVSAIFICFCLAINSDLYSIVFGSLASAFVGFIWVYSSYKLFFRDLLQPNTSTFKGINWRNEIWPFQWRIAVSWASGYLVFQIFTPMVLATHGPTEAGRMGMSMQIFNALNAGAMVWVSTKIPAFGNLIAKGDRKQLDFIFFQSLKQSTVLLLIGILFCAVLLILLNHIGSDFYQRLLQPFLLGFLAIACISNHIVFAEAAYLRAHKEEPFMVVSVLNGISTLVLALILIRPYGAVGAVLSYACSTLFIALFYGTFIFLRKRKQWGCVG